MKKNNIFEKNAHGKTFYIASAIAIVAIIASVFAIRYTGGKLMEELPNTTSTTIPTQIFTTAAQNEVTDIPDTRDESTTEITETSTEKKTEPSTTEKETKSACASITNNEFFLPIGDAKPIREYSPSKPIKSETMGDWRVHNGIDFEAKENDEVHSVGNGVVTKVISDPKWGYIIEIDHGSFTGRYCAIDQETAVGIGTELSAGDVIGKITSVPVEAADGFHLHFEAVRDGAYIDPLEALAKTE